MASNRWIAINVDVLNHPLVGAGQPVAPADPCRGSYSRLEAWFWMISEANFEAGHIINRGRRMRLDRGDLAGAYSFLAHTWNWTPKTVRSWLEKLIEEGMISRRVMHADEQMQHGQVVPTSEPTKGKQFGNHAQVLTICNYDRYQFSGDTTPMSQGQARGKQLGKQKGKHQGKQLSELSTSKQTEKDELPPQQRQAPGQAKGQAKGQAPTEVFIEYKEYNSSKNIVESNNIGINSTPRALTRTRGLAAADRGFWARTLNHEVASAEHDCRRDQATGDLLVANGFRAELLAAVGNERELDELVKIAGGYVGSQVRGPDLKNRVRAKVLELHRAERKRAENYRAAANRSAAKPGQPTKETDDEFDRRMRALCGDLASPVSERRR